MNDWKAVAFERYPSDKDQLATYVELLATLGVERGLIGPREVDRLWNRHILNCASVVDSTESLVRRDVTVIDVGTGAGLPGLVWAIIRPDLRVVLVESMQRRIDFLEIAVADLGLSDRVSTLRGRAEDLAGVVSGDVVTARAVAPMDRLLGWLAPLATPGGEILVLKGQNVINELNEAAPELAAIKAVSVQVHTCGVGWLDEPANVVQIQGFEPNGLDVTSKRGKSRGASNRRR